MAGLVFNDRSLHGQFPNVDSFADYCEDIICPILDFINERDISVLKCYGICELMVTETHNVAKVLSILSKYPEFSKIKGQIIKLLDSPFTEDDVHTVAGVTYEYPEKFEEPNCFTEAIERLYALLSVKDDGLPKIVQCKKDSIDVNICCVKEMEDLFSYLIHDTPRLFLRDVVEKRSFNGIKVCFAQTDTGYPAEENLIDDDLADEDIIKIYEGLPKMIDDKKNGNQTPSWKHLRNEIFEYRINISAGRIYRLLYSWEDKMVLLSGFIKKEQKTPPREIDRAEKNLKKMRALLKN